MKAKDLIIKLQTLDPETIINSFTMTEADFYPITYLVEEKGKIFLACDNIDCLDNCNLL